MKKIAIAALVSTLAAAPAFAADSGWYAGLNLGSASVGTPITAATYTSTRNTVGGVQLGYQFDKNWGAEMFFTGAGKFTTSTGVSGKSDVWGVNAVGTLPVSDAFSVYAKLGIASASTKITQAAGGTVGNKSRSTATYGIGVQYNATPTVGVRLGVDSYGLAIVNGQGSNETDNYNSTVTSLGVVFKF